MLNRVGVQKGFSYLKPFGFDKIVQNDYRLPLCAGRIYMGLLTAGDG